MNALRSEAESRLDASTGQPIPMGTRETQRFLRETFGIEVSEQIARNCLKALLLHGKVVTGPLVFSEFGPAQCASARSQRGWSGVVLAEFADVSYSELGQWERGQIENWEDAGRVRAALESGERLGIGIPRPLTQWRERHRLTRKRLAQACNVDSGTMRTIEDGERSIPKGLQALILSYDWTGKELAQLQKDHTAMQLARQIPAGDEGVGDFLGRPWGVAVASDHKDWTECLQELRRTLGSRIRDGREHAGLNRTQLGRIVGGDYTRVLNWENGKALPHPMHIKRLSEVLSVTSDYLLGLMDDRPSDIAVATRLLTSMFARMTDDQRRALLSAGHEMLEHSDDTP